MKIENHVLREDFRVWTKLPEIRLSDYSADLQVQRRVGNIITCGANHGRTAVKQRTLCSLIPPVAFQIQGLVHRELPVCPVIRFVKDENAATAIEYGLIASGIALALIPVLTGLGVHLKATFSTISSALK
jgi:pilus assembly protein Flp/PilA